jgi:hypothetical protein
MSDEMSTAASAEPLKSVAAALDAAAQAIQDGVRDLASTASGAVPALDGLLSRLTYKTCYAVSYGVVLSTVLVARAIPKENAAVHGFIDGARAAIDAVDEMRSGAASNGHADSSVAGLSGDAT